MIELRTHQVECIRAILDSPSTRQLISMPTGTGKTVTFLSLAKQLNKKCLVLVHRSELLEQTYSKALELGFSKDQVSIVAAGEKSPFSLLTIAMVASLKNSLFDYSTDSVDLVIVDEAHHSLAPSYLTIFRHFNVLDDPQKMLVGFTATPIRGDGKCLSSIYDHHSFKMTLEEATKKGFICPVHGIRVNISYSLENVRNVGGDYDAGELDKLVNCEELNSLVADRCASLERTPCIIFCASVDHAQKIGDRLMEHGRSAEVISYRNSPVEASQIISRLRGGKIDFILNAVKLTEGFDFPYIRTVVIARPTRSAALYKQMVGRGLRLSPGKTDCLVMEFGFRDPNMINWEDIDSSSTFQCFSQEERVSREDALKAYRIKLSSPKVQVLDVRVSPFSYYECFIWRTWKHKKLFMCFPDDFGFMVARIKPVRGKDSRGSYRAWDFDVFLFEWVDRYKSFFLFSSGHAPRHTPVNTLEQVEGNIIYFSKHCHSVEEGQSASLGRWYPSEEEPMSPWQKTRLPNVVTNARKAEMMIEAQSIEQAIDKFIITDKVPLGEGYTEETNHIYCI